MATPRPFRFGVVCESARTPAELLATARAAEAAGYATCLIRDHFVDAPFGHQLAPLTALAAVAAATTTLRVGGWVFANDYRPPVLLAKELTTLDQVSGGRVEVGLGTGFLQTEYDQAGIPLDPPGVRVDRFGEAVQVYRGLLSGEPFTFHGRHYTLTDVASFPPPVQRPRPPILVGAGGKRMLTLAGRYADSVGLLSVSTADGVLVRDPARRLVAAVGQQVEWVRAGAGARFGEIELGISLSVVVASDRREAAACFGARQGWSEIGPETVLEMPSVAIGTPDQIAADLLARRERLGISYYVLADRQAAEFAPVVARLAGR